MSLEFISLKCPECGAKLNNIDSSREHIFCEYCGTKIMVHNENEYIYKTVDEASIKKTEAEKEIGLKKLEISQKNTMLLIKASVILGAVAILFLLIGSLTRNSNLYYVAEGAFVIIGFAWLFKATGSMNGKIDNSHVGEIRVPDCVNDLKNQNYKSIEMEFKNIGFSNVNCIPLNDLTTGFLKKPDSVEMVTINGKTACGGTWVHPNSYVAISYHSFK